MKKKVIPYKFIYGTNGTPGVLEYLLGGGRDAAMITECSKHHLMQIRERYDCADFRANNLLRAWLSYGEYFTDALSSEYKETLLGMPYTDEAGNSMCTWTENHQLCFAACRLLLGERFPDDVFHDGQTGSVNAAEAEKSIDGWCDYILRFGFSEFGSANYYPLTFMGCANILEFSRNETLKEKLRIVVDLLCFDVMTSATEDLSYNKATARAYIDNKTNYKNYMKPIIEALLERPVTDRRETAAAFTEMLAHRDENGEPYYRMPAVFKEIFSDTEKELYESNGVDVTEFKKLGLDRYSEEKVRYQFTLGAITPRQVIAHTVRYLSEHRMYQNSMLHVLSPFDHPVFYRTPLLYLVRCLVPLRFDDMATGRGNCVTYVRGNYAVSSLRKYHVGMGAFQQNTFSVTIGDLGLFGNCPTGNNDKSKSPDYWTGSLVNPDIAQDKGVLLVIYDLSKNKKKDQKTHLFFPLNKFDEVNTEHQRAGILFARKDGVNVMVRTNRYEVLPPQDDVSLRSGNKLANHDFSQYDLMNRAAGRHFYIFDLDTELSFEAFTEDRLNRPFAFDEQKLTYDGRVLSYRKSFTANGVSEEPFVRLRSKYIDGGVYRAGDPVLRFVRNGYSHTIDFGKKTREEGGVC